jgi:hypothetical protein
MAKKKKGKKQASFKQEAQRRSTKLKGARKPSPGSASKPNAQLPPGLAEIVARAWEQGQQKRLGNVFQPGTPGVPNPTIQPFMTPDDLMEQLSFDQTRDERFRESDAAVATAKADRDYNLHQLHENFLKSTANTTDEMIGRGLFQSSIKDAALYDLEAQRAIQDRYLNEAFRNQEIAAQSVKDAYLGEGGYNQRFQSALNQRMVQNAQGLNDEREPWKVAPTAGRWVPGPKAPTKSGPQGSPQKPNQQNWKGTGVGMPNRQTTLGVGKQMTVRKHKQKNPRESLSVGRR